ncbi:hypothetical protein V1514DRAFT_338143 [Lipomyces japonicus]|uniref:uncharacterized protein n=1 Tax=Lipomyces japonicus TaxID=56871 RepID=UPI0034CF6CF2
MSDQLQVPSSFSQRSASSPRLVSSSSQNLLSRTDSSRSDVPSLRLDTKISASSNNLYYLIINRAKDLSQLLTTHLKSLRQSEHDETEVLSTVQVELLGRIRELQEYADRVRDLRDQALEITKVLEQENERTRITFTAQLDDMEDFKNELQVVDKLEGRLKEATNRVEDYKARLEQIRSTVQVEQRRQLELERRTTAQRGIIWRCVSIGTGLTAILCSIHFYKLHSTS